MGNKSVVEVDGSQELLKRLGKSGLRMQSTQSAGGVMPFLLTVWPKKSRVAFPRMHLSLNHSPPIVERSV